MNAEQGLADDSDRGLLNDGTRTFTYDQANRATQIISGTNTYAFAYNGLSDRISQTVNSVLTRYTLDPAAGLTQVLADGTSTYLYGAGSIAQQQTNMQYFGADGLGSVRQLYNLSGQIVFNKRYDPFGNVLSGAEGSAQDVGISHLFNYPRCPRVNGCVERYQRTLSKTSLQAHEDSIREPQEFCRHLAGYLVYYDSA